MIDIRVAAKGSPAFYAFNDAQFVILFEAS
jgi:hypothetical protein